MTATQEIDSCTKTLIEPRIHYINKRKLANRKKALIRQKPIKKLMLR